MSNPPIPSSPLQPPAAIQQACHDRLQRYLQALDNGTTDQSWPWHDSRPIDPDSPALPDPIAQTYQHYKTHVMDQDWGCIHGAYWIEPANPLTQDLAISSDAGPSTGSSTGSSTGPSTDLSLIVLYIDTDGDDGWLELFEPNGQPLATARTYDVHIHWGDPSTLREQVFTGELPPELEALLGPA